VEYAERLTVPLRWWVQATMLIATFWLALAVAVPPVAAFSITGAACLLMAAGFLRYGASRIEVHGNELRAGRAHIATAYVGVVTPLDKEQARLAAGRDADARAFLLLRPYLKRAVRVEINDPADPTPYWLISTRHPKRLARALSS
jgi:HAMP domain-containing protein